MSPLLESYGVRVVALSRDTPQQVIEHRQRDGITFSLLSDTDVSVIERFGLLHEGALTFRTFLIGPMRFPLGWPIGFKKMAIPTTLLLDEKHIVQWIDQADDYRVRGDETRTRQALQEAFGDPPGTP